MTTLTTGSTPTSAPALRATRRMLITEWRLLLRSPATTLWTCLAPIAALIVLGSIPALGRPMSALHGESYLAAYLPILIAFAAAMGPLNSLPPTLAAYRERGVLRRMATTPVPAARLLGVQAVVYAGLSVATGIVLLVVGIAAYGTGTPRQLGGFVLALLLLNAACIAIGLLVAAVAGTAKAANAIALVLFFPLMFLAGLWVPRAEMPSALRTVSDYSPLGAGVRALQDAAAGQFPSAHALLVLLGWTVVAGAVALRTFRWE